MIDFDRGKIRLPQEYCDGGRVLPVDEWGTSRIEKSARAAVADNYTLLGQSDFRMRLGLSN